MPGLQHLFDNNRRWSRAMRAAEPGFFDALAQQQSPRYLWIGCSDSRVPANQIVGLLPGEIFVHRNVANVVVHSDLNCLSVIQFAVDVLKVEHIIVCGHYGCSGVGAALRDERYGLVDNWLRHIQDVYQRHRRHFAELSPVAGWDRLCELNVSEQVLNVTRTTIVQDAWQRGQPLAVHGWIYGLRDGLLQDLGLTIGDPAEAMRQAARAMADGVPALGGQASISEAAGE
jgi:carbonic anhydrase